MISSVQIFYNSINNYINYFKENKLLFTMFVAVTNAEYALAKLPSEAYKGNLVLMSFDFGAENTWVADQICFNDKTLTMSCVLVYKVNGEFTEFPVEFPVSDIAAITNIDNFVPIKSEVQLDKDFLEKVQNSKKHLKLVQSKEE